MLGLAEFTVISTDLWGAAVRAQNSINSALTTVATRDQAVNIAKKFAQQYVDDYHAILNDGLTEVTENAVDHYSTQLGLQVDNYDQVVQGIVGNSYTEPYYGATLNQRLKMNEIRLSRNITKSSFWGGVEYEGLQKLLTEPIPYGSQFNFDKRILLAQSQKIEQDTAKVLGKEAGVELVQWTTSALHQKPDICDDYATYQSKDVVKYIEDNRLDISPKGVYFLEELPHPPHPNCQCEFGLVQGKKITSGPVKRTIQKIRGLLQRFRKK